MFIMERNGNVVSSSEAGDAVTPIPAGKPVSDPVLLSRVAAVHDELPRAFTTGSGGEARLVCVSAIPWADWFLVARIPYRTMNAASRSVVTSVVLVCLIMTAVASAAATTIFAGIQRPLVRLSAAASHIRSGTFDLRLNDTYPDEVGAVSRAIDEMTVRLEQLVCEIKTQQEEKRRIELEMLQAQINPHFLFNALNSLKWTAALSGDDMVSEGIGALSDLLHSTILETGEFVPLERELESLRNYALVQKLRYGDSFELLFNVPEELHRCRILKLLLQPFIENSIIHGISEEAPGRVSIRLAARRSEAGDLEIVVADNGAGFEPDGGGAGRTFSGIGLHNVERRIALHYGAGYGVRIESRPGGGTIATIVVPYEHHVVPEAT
jgi:two-component system sensor histidine kinase YesM